MSSKEPALMRPHRDRLSADPGVIPGQLAPSRSLVLRGPSFVLAVHAGTVADDGVHVELSVLTRSDPQIDGLAGFGGPEDDDGSVGVWLEHAGDVVLAHLQSGHQPVTSGDGSPLRGSYSLWFPLDVAHLVHDVGLVLRWPARTAEVARVAVPAAELREAAGRAITLP